jgi:hypothetical protein
MTTSNLPNINRTNKAMLRTIFRSLHLCFAALIFAQMQPATNFRKWRR